MSRIITTETTAYTYDELSDSAKETAREQWNRFLWEDGSAQESMELLFDGLMEDRGWQDATLGSYSLHSQGGYPSFTGTLSAFEHDGQTWVLTVTTRHGGGSSDYMVCDVEPTNEDDAADYGTPEWDAYLARNTAAREAAESMVRDLSSELYWAFVAEDDYQSSDDAVRETSEANGYEYDEDGNLI